MDVVHLPINTYLEYLMQENVCIIKRTVYHIKHDGEIELFWFQSDFTLPSNALGLAHPFLPRDKILHRLQLVMSWATFPAEDLMKN